MAGVNSSDDDDWKGSVQVPGPTDGGDGARGDGPAADLTLGDGVRKVVGYVGDVVRDGDSVRLVQVPGDASGDGARGDGPARDLALRDGVFQVVGYVGDVVREGDVVRTIQVPGPNGGDSARGDGAASVDLALRDGVCGVVVLGVTIGLGLLGTTTNPMEEV